MFLDPYFPLHNPSSPMPYPCTFSEFHQLADEAEDELREMESMLALLPPPAPPNDKKTMVDTSIESAAKEMTEIEGKASHIAPLILTIHTVYSLIPTLTSRSPAELG